ncbi:Squalene synthase [Hondaea fermentalgiana]|uniref:Squalene synthase n=1 Tax=Hondaea fermentalgiana TaxID=2315210 RepID=A0A2R5GLG2_9STRA|nr:Squalene synthase [Hondaea fermentalgiana]|eukprot:GBG31736.1 Squalene synthase [Hondaea fermentalgiana]
MVTFSLEVLICFVLVDFLVASQWGSLIAAFTTFLFILSQLDVLSTSRKEDKKQGGYGQIQEIKHPLIQMLRPSELYAVMRYKTGAFSRPSYLGAGLERLNLDKDHIEFCSVKLKQVSRSFATVITFLPNTSEAPIRLAVGIFYIVLRALDTVEDDMNLANFDSYVLDEDKTDVGDARLAAKERLLRQFATRLRDSVEGAAHKHQPLAGFGEGAERELVENMEAVVYSMSVLPPKLQEVIYDITDEMAVGMAEFASRDLKNGTEDEKDFEHYCHTVAGTVGDGLTRIFAAGGYCPADLVNRRDLWDSMGSFLQRTNIIRDYLEDLVDGRAWWPRSVWELYVPKDSSEFARSKSLSRLADTASIESGQSTSCLNHMIADALERVNHCLQYLENFDDPDIVSFCALPQVMAIATLSVCFDNPKVFQGVVKIRKGQAARIMLDLSPMEHPDIRDLQSNYLEWFARCTREIQQKAQRASRLDPQAQRVDTICSKIVKVVDAKLQCLQESSTPLGRPHAD